MSESCHAWMSRVATHDSGYPKDTCLIHMYADLYFGVIAHTWASRVTHEWVMSHMNESCHTWMSHVTHEWVMSHINESRRTYEWVTLQVQMSHHGAHLNELWHTHERVMSHTWRSHLIFESWHTNEWVMAHTWTSHSVECTHEWVIWLGDKKHSNRVRTHS